MALYKCPRGGPSVELVPWSTGTDEQIKAMVDAYYDGALTLAAIQSVWNIGDERSVNLSAMSWGGGIQEVHIAQTVKFVIMNFGGKKLASDGTTDVLAIVGQKNILLNSSSSDVGGPMNDNDTTSGGWDSCPRRSWCNSTYRNSIPSDFLALFKQFNNITAIGRGATTAVSVDFFALPSEKEIFGVTSYSNSTAEADNTQFAYYETADNRLKYIEGSAKKYSWWERSPSNSDATKYCAVYEDGWKTSYTTSNRRGIAPFGCI